MRFVSCGSPPNCAVQLLGAVQFQSSARMPEKVGKLPASGHPQRKWSTAFSEHRSVAINTYQCRCNDSL